MLFDYILTGLFLRVSYIVEAGGATSLSAAFVQLFYVLTLVVLLCQYLTLCQFSLVQLSISNSISLIVFVAIGVLCILFI